jgi:DNA-binding MarR family transcriptional regulator
VAAIQEAMMSYSIREITKIAREVSKFTVRTMKAEGIGTAEFDFIHVVRKNPGITQAGIREILPLDKGACARRAANLEAKGYLVRKPNPEDRRSARLYATPKAERLKMSKATIEAHYYEWLFSGLTEEERQTFLPLLHKVYQRNKEESKAGFVHVEKALKEACDEKE